MDRWLLKAQSLMEEIQRIAAQIHALRKHHLRDAHLNRTRWAILLTIHRSAYRLSISDLARVLKLPRQTTHRTVASLARKGWIELRPNADDARLLQLFLTDRGKASITQVRQDFSRFLMTCRVEADVRELQRAEKLLRNLRLRMAESLPPDQ